MTYKERLAGVDFLSRTLKTFVEEEKLDKGFSDLSSYINKVVNEESSYNAFFTKENILFSLRYWSEKLDFSCLSQWFEKYKAEGCNEPKRIAIISAGNIPLVSFHDIISVFLTGNKALVKLSSKDARFPKLMLKIICEKYPEAAEYISFFENETLPVFDAVIATGSEGTQKYFDYYFGKYPHIFRGHRNGIAVLDGTETTEQLEKLADDVFLYFGLGCRSVSKLYIPVGYNFDLLFNAFMKWEHLFSNHHYINNYEYQKSLLMINKEPFVEGGFYMLKESNQISSPIGVIFYEYYSDICILAPKFEALSQQIQCIVSKENKLFRSVDFGQAQQPELWDYADGIDVVKFLIHL